MLTMATTAAGIPAELVHRAGLTLVHTVWEASVCGVLLAVFLKVGVRSSAATRYLASCAALVLVLLAAVATFIALRAPVVTEVPAHHAIAILPAHSTPAAVNAVDNVQRDRLSASPSWDR